MTRDLMTGGDEERQALFWVLNLADGKHDLLDMAGRSKLAFDVVRRAASALDEAKLIERGGVVSGRTVRALLAGSGGEFARRTPRDGRRRRGRHARHRRGAVQVRVRLPPANGAVVATSRS